MDEKLIQHFKERATKYNKLTAWVQDPKVLDMVLDFVEPKDNMKIIDVGAGTGVVLEKMLIKYPNICECVALDSSKEMLNMISSNLIKKCLNDAHNIPFSDNYFDVVICRQAFHYMDDIVKVINEIHRILTSDGYLIIGQITPFGDEDKEFWEHLFKIRQPLRKHFFTREKLVTLLENNSFEIENVSQISIRGSLKSWLEAYESSTEQIEKLWYLFINAPERYKKIHNFEYLEDDVTYDRCWTFIKAFKD